MSLLFLNWLVFDLCLFFDFLRLSGVFFALDIDFIIMEQRFITLIDILYEKNVPLLISSKSKLSSISSSISLRDVFKRTISRLHELTSTRFN